MAPEAPSSAGDPAAYSLLSTLKVFTLSSGIDSSLSSFLAIKDKPSGASFWGVTLRFVGESAREI
jgi:sorbitol-specific phosphotransferase system component IIC